MNTAKALLENRKRGVEITPTYDLWGICGEKDITW